MEAQASEICSLPQGPAHIFDGSYPFTRDQVSNLKSRLQASMLETQVIFSPTLPLFAQNNFKYPSYSNDHILS